jgi:hypothetical protein
MISLLQFAPSPSWLPSQASFYPTPSRRSCVSVVPLPISSPKQPQQLDPNVAHGTNDIPPWPEIHGLRVAAPTDDEKHGQLSTIAPSRAAFALPVSSAPATAIPSARITTSRPPNRALSNRALQSPTAAKNTQPYTQPCAHPLDFATNHCAFETSSVASERCACRHGPAWDSVQPRPSRSSHADPNMSPVIRCEHLCPTRPLRTSTQPPSQSSCPAASCTFWPAPLDKVYMSCRTNTVSTHKTDAEQWIRHHSGHWHGNLLGACNVAVCITRHMKPPQSRVVTSNCGLSLRAALRRTVRPWIPKRNLRLRHYNV